MLFNSYSFLIFFTVVFLVSRGIVSWRWRKIFLLLVSYYFYAAWNPPFVLLVWFSTIFDWVLANRIHRTTDPRRRKTYLIFSLLVNLGLLSYFKYGNFILDNFVYAVNKLGLPYHPAMPSIVLPVGISFYTFVTLSYVFDVYRGRITPWHSFLDYALYVTFFPHLVAGPIVRPEHLLPQFLEPKKAAEGEVGWGVCLIVIGLFNKAVVADRVFAPVVDAVFDCVSPGTVQAWLAAFAFMGQLFADFAGYSTCAVGAAMCLGFWFPRNFRCPYGAVGFADFWSRWHITLSTWLRDYLYIPLGGNRCSARRNFFNVMATMLIGGLWHGASWLFVIWGGLHGLLIASERVLHRFFGHYPIFKTNLSRVALSWATFTAVAIVGVFFRASTMPVAGRMLAAMANLGHGPAVSAVLPFDAGLAAAAVFLMWLIHWCMRERSLESVAAALPWPVSALALSCMAYVILISIVGADRAFIYFQF